MKHFLSKNFQLILLILLFTISLSYRLINLGYSDYQGDEIKALLIPKDNQSITEFLLTQRKGPMQFLVTWGTQWLSNDYENRFVVRLPFAFAGFISVIMFYLISKKLTSNFYAQFFSTAIFSLNGFFLSFSRFAQYQSLVILFGLLSIYLLFLAINNEKYKNWGILLASLCFSFSLLSHYDALFFIPILFFLYLEWFKKFHNLKITIYSLLLSLTILGSFYIPYLNHPNFEKTSDYLNSRVDGTLGIQEKLPSSMLFKVYNPKFVSTIYIILFLAFFINSENFKNSWKILAWLVLNFVGMEYIIKLSGTHIYVYLIPLIFLFVIGITNILEFSKLRYISIGLLTLFLLFILYQSFIIHLDSNREFPYEDGYLFGKRIEKPNGNYQLPLFGFPHYRHWDKIQKFFDQKGEKITFSSNEETPITRFYMKRHERDSRNAKYYIRIKNPQSFAKDTTKSGVLQRLQNKEPELVFKNNDKVVVEIFNLE